MPTVRTAQLGTSCSRCSHVITAMAMPLIQRSGTNLTCPRCRSDVRLPPWVEIDEDDNLIPPGDGSAATGDGVRASVQMEHRRRRMPLHPMIPHAISAAQSSADS